MNRLYASLFFLALCCTCVTAEAAGLKSKSDVATDQTFNPVPVADDILLPMPCGLSMAFKAVEVPAQGFLWDVSFGMGNDVSGRPGMDYYDRRFRASIAAPFGINDMPVAWKESLPQNPQVPFQYYLVGKYEVSEAQWQAVMEGICPAAPQKEVSTEQSESGVQAVVPAESAAPAPVKPGEPAVLAESAAPAPVKPGEPAVLAESAAPAKPGESAVLAESAAPAKPGESARAVKPKTGISWYDAQAFVERYNTWLLEHAGNLLPRFAGDDKNIGFVRLPTETEWEYAARGGARVTSEALNQELFHPIEEGTSIADYAVFRPEGGATVQEGPLPIGSRRANPLGLHDMSGNVAEMVQDSFHFSLGGRLHGSSGGYVRKGGSFASGESEILPGYRDEVAFFNARGPVSTNDMGIRLALSGINTPGGSRAESLMSEWKSIGEETSVVKEGGNPLQEIDKLLALTPTGSDKDNLTRLRALIKDGNVALERQQAASAEGLIRTMLYMGETVRNYGVRHNIAHRRVEDIANLIKDGEKKNVPQADITRFKAAQKQFIDARHDMVLAMESAVNFYKSKLEETAAYPAETINYAYNLLSNELKQDNLLSHNMRQNLELFAIHLKLFRTHQSDALTKSRLLKDILPDNLQVGLTL